MTCYQGFYCPKTETKSEPKRCPTGTFSPHKNATSIKDCLPCPTDKNEREHWKRKMETKIVAMFQTNCHSSSLIQGESHRPGIKIRILHFDFQSRNRFLLTFVVRFMWDNSLQEKYMAADSSVGKLKFSNCLEEEQRLSIIVPENILEI